VLEGFWWKNIKKRERPLGKLWHRWEDTEIYLIGIGSAVLEHIHVIQYQEE
jgi:hypothetical protein